MENAAFKIELLPNGIIFVERQNNQAEQALGSGFKRVGELAEQQRSQGKPVLILNHARGIEVSPQVLEFLLRFDFDKIAVYGTSERVNNKRDLMVRANGMERKIASFQTESEARTWLQSFLRD